LAVSLVTDTFRKVQENKMKRNKSTKISVSWDLMSSLLVNGFWGSVGVYSYHHLTYETLIHTYVTAGRPIPNNVKFLVITGRNSHLKKPC